MKTRLKYVIIEPCGIKLAILLHEAITHSQAVNLSQVKPLSAGFVQISEDAVKVESQGSTSLNIGPRPGDAQIIEDTLALMGLRPLTPRAIARQYLQLD